MIKTLPSPSTPLPVNTESFRKSLSQTPMNPSRNGYPLLAQVRPPSSAPEASFRFGSAASSELFSCSTHPYFVLRFFPRPLPSYGEPFLSRLLKTPFREESLPQTSLRFPFSLLRSSPPQGSVDGPFGPKSFPNPSGPFPLPLLASSLKHRKHPKTDPPPPRPPYFPLFD